MTAAMCIIIYQIAISARNIRFRKQQKLQYNNNYCFGRYATCKCRDIILYYNKPT